MANKKKKSRRQGLASKLINVGIIAYAFQTVITLALGGRFAELNNALTFGLVNGKLDINAGAAVYAPMAGAIGLGAMKSYLMRKFPVRR